MRGVIHGAGLWPPRRAGACARTVAVLGGGDIADILFTAGTTGPAKGCTKPQGNLPFGRGSEGLRRFEKPAPMLAPMPLGTTSSATTAAIALTSPAELILTRVEDVESVGELIARFRTGSMTITPWTAMPRMIAPGSASGTV